MSFAGAPPEPGSYALHLRLPAALCGLGVGRLGRLDFPAGDYLYLGSARGPGGLRARLAHHARTSPLPHWHIDFLRAQAQLYGAWVARAEGPLECTWSQALLALPGFYLAAPGFGASDCHLGCPAHLVGVLPGLPTGWLESVLRSGAQPLVWLPYHSGQ